MIVRATDVLAQGEWTEVLDLIAAAAAADGRPPVSAETLLELRPASRAGELRHVLAVQSDGLVGYGCLTTASGPRAMLAELAVRPDARRHGVGEAVLGAMQGLVAPAQVSIWAHGSDSATAQFAQAMGMRAQRRLHQMRMGLDHALPAGNPPPGYRLRTFEPGRDDAAFLRANAAAFTDLPDQGSWTQTDLQSRISQSWFDPAGFFLAQAEGELQLAGFHWTKLHPPEPLGEIYVLGVLPAHRGRGLARALALHGLGHLRSVGARTALLYVDAVNAAAVHLYEGIGFHRADTDTLFAG